MIKKKFQKILPKRKPKSHKGDYGHVFILAGSVGLTGAAYLCSQAAILSGSGLVTLGIPKSLNPIMARKLTEVMTLPLPETGQQSLNIAAFKKIKDFAKKADVLAIGPGLSQNKQTQGLVRKVILKIDKPMVIDADGLNALVGHLDILHRKNAKIPQRRKTLILTPHPGEMARLLSKKVSFVQKNRIKIAKEFAKKYNVILVLKGHKTVIANPKGVMYTNTTGNPGMATAGVGDILTGMISSFIGQRLEPFLATKLAVYIHGLAGDLAAKEKGQISLIATDLLKKLPEAIRTVTH